MTTEMEALERHSKKPRKKKKSLLNIKNNRLIILWDMLAGRKRKLQDKVFYDLISFFQ